jgi:hypothetical protein
MEPKELLELSNKLNEVIDAVDESLKDELLAMLREVSYELFKAYDENNQ